MILSLDLKLKNTSQLVTFIQNVMHYTLFFDSIRKRQRFNLSN